jgi:hypothetical protein
LRPAAPPPIIKSKPDSETSTVTPVRVSRPKLRGPGTFMLGWRLLERGPRTANLGSGKVAGKVLIVDHR